MQVEQPPLNTDREMAAYLVRMFQQIHDTLLRINNLPLLTALPSRPIRGSLYWFQNGIPFTPVTRGGLWFYGKEGWVVLSDPAPF